MRKCKPTGFIWFSLYFRPYRDQVRVRPNIKLLTSKDLLRLDLSVARNGRGGGLVLIHHATPHMLCGTVPQWHITIKVSLAFPQRGKESHLPSNSWYLEDLND